MEKEGVPNKYLETIHNRILSSIESIYFMNSAAKKTLIDFGIYERDVNEIIKIIGSDFVDVNDMKNRLNKNKDKFIKISYISKYIIDNYIGN